LENPIYSQLKHLTYNRGHIIFKTPLKNVFWPHIFVGTSFQILDNQQVACGLKLGPAAHVPAKPFGEDGIWNHNPIFETGSSYFNDVMLTGYGFDMKTFLAGISLLLLFFANSEGFADQVYTWTDKDGNMHITAEPPPKNARVKEVLTYEPQTETNIPDAEESPVGGGEGELGKQQPEEVSRARARAEKARQEAEIARAKAEEATRAAEKYIETHNRNEYMRRAHKYEMRKAAEEARAAQEQARIAEEKAIEAEKKAKFVEDRSKELND